MRNLHLILWKANDFRHEFRTFLQNLYFNINYTMYKKTKQITTGLEFCLLKHRKTEGQWSDRKQSRHLPICFVEKCKSRRSGVHQSELQSGQTQTIHHSWCRPAVSSTFSEMTETWNTSFISRDFGAQFWWCTLGCLLVGASCKQPEKIHFIK